VARSRNIDKELLDWLEQSPREAIEWRWSEVMYFYRSHELSIRRSIQEAKKKWGDRRNPPGYEERRD
jgi:hypothetical protein